MKLDRKALRKIIFQTLNESKVLFPFPKRKPAQGKETQNKVQFPFGQDPDDHDTIASLSDRDLNLRGYNDGLVGNMAAHYGNDAYMAGYHDGQEDAYEDQDTEDYE